VSAQVLYFAPAHADQMQQCLLDPLIGPSRSAYEGDRYLVYGPPLGLNDQAVALRNALA